MRYGHPLAGVTAVDGVSARLVSEHALEPVFWISVTMPGFLPRREATWQARIQATVRKVGPSSGREAKRP
ncbi:hypothetical protein FDG2_1306 [Candidatus Protofrankia californiensis]|uniref:Uncharacterized protein n=1 Tax=Candidatus Protofrankia californiensis TaxID=1839754 RepID=A0A1C3NVF1_9ACTN|nr:hypothetical protein FDG2_1306 [Candidatus Protofrankia californiensis]